MRRRWNLIEGKVGGGDANGWLCGGKVSRTVQCARYHCIECATVLSTSCRSSKSLCLHGMPGLRGSIRRFVMATQSVSAESAVLHAEDEWVRQSRGFYVCPACRHDLEPTYDELYCRACARIYPVLGGIPDFTVINLEESRNRSLRAVGKNDNGFLLDFIATAYESCVYPFACNLYGGWHSTSLKQLAHDISDIVGSRDGVILD